MSFVLLVDCEGNALFGVEFDSQRASDAKRVSLSSRHHVKIQDCGKNVKTISSG